MPSYGMISAWGDLTLMQVLTHGQRHIMCDPLLDTYKISAPEHVWAALRSYINILLEQGVTHILVWPRYEYMIMQDSQYAPYVVPLFECYMKEFVLAYTLVGKLGFRGDRADIEMIEKMIWSLRKNFVASARQQSLSKFHHHLPLWTLETDLQRQLIWAWYKRHRVLNNVIKYDLHHFKDADVDTLVPLDYVYWQTEKILKHYFNTRKRRFHGLSALQQLLLKLMPWWQDIPYHVTLMHTRACESLQWWRYAQHILSKSTDIHTQDMRSYFVSQLWS